MAKRTLPENRPAGPPGGGDQHPKAQRRSRRFSTLRSLGLGVITGAADDDPSAIGTYAAAGAKFGPAMLWTAPVAFPMMFAVVHLSGKIGQVTGQGLFAVLRRHYPLWILYPTLACVLIGNIIEAGADIGGMAAAFNVLVPVPMPIMVVLISLVILALQLWGSYTLIRNTFRWLALSLLAYGAAAFLAHPDPNAVIYGTLLPRIEFTREYLSMLVAIIGTSLSAYLYTWQSNEEVEEKIASGRRRPSQRRGASEKELKQARLDVLLGMFFSSVVMYFVMLSTSTTLFKAGVTEINSAAEAAEALRPLAGDAAGILFALGVFAVGFLAVPVMTIGAAYDLAQTFGWKHGLNYQPRQAKKFYIAIVIFMALAVGMNFLGFNPMKALVFAGIVQGLSTPPLMLLIMFITNNRTVMGRQVNSLPMNVLGSITTVVIFAASIGLIVSYVV